MANIAAVVVVVVVCCVVDVCVAAVAGVAVVVVTVAGLLLLLLLGAAVVEELSVSSGISECGSFTGASSASCQSSAFSSTGSSCNCKEMMHVIMTWTWT